MGDDTAIDIDEFLDDTGQIDSRAFLREFAQRTDEWAGIPYPLDDFRLQLEDRYPYKAIENLGATRPHPPRECSTEDVKPVAVRNKWFSNRRNCYVWVVQDEKGIHAETLPRRGRHADRVTFWVNTIGASLAWDLKAEQQAMEKLFDLVRPNIAKMYVLTGSLLETSERSGLTYMFRKCRPTVVLAPMRRWLNNSPLKVLAVLCLHPIGYYEETWAGVMVPTDDVIAHLLMMRADEHYFWRHANQHDPDSPEAGI